MTALDELIDFADAAADPTKVLFWSGAGMSVPGPTSLPTGWELSERAFRAFFEPDTLATVLGYHAQLGWLTADICDRTTTRNARLPRLETILGVAERGFPAEVAEILGDIAAAEPNWYHRFFAQHLAVGGRHITANFDTCIEKAYTARPGRLAASSAGPVPLVEHFHNRLDSSTTAAQLGSTLERIQGGFDDATRARLVDMAEVAGTIVFTGYSGSDFFDVDVAFAQLDPGRLSGRRVCWIAHSNRCSWHEVHPGPDRLPPLASHLREAGAEVRFFCGPTDGFLAELAARWHFALAAPAPAPRRVADITVKVLQKDRRAATFSLYRELGIPAEIERLLNENRSGGDKALDVDAAALLIARSEMLWEQGR